LSLGLLSLSTYLSEIRIIENKTLLENGLYDLCKVKRANPPHFLFCKCLSQRLRSEIAKEKLVNYIGVAVQKNLPM
jgi:hypothetical protein